MDVMDERIKRLIDAYLATPIGVSPFENPEVKHAVQAIVYGGVA